MSHEDQFTLVRIDPETGAMSLCPTGRGNHTYIEPSRIDEINSREDLVWITRSRAANIQHLYPPTHWKYLPYNPIGWRLSLQRHRERNAQSTPWASDLPAIEDHFAFLKSDTGEPLIEFYADIKKGLAGVPTRMKPGRYLTKFYPNLPATEVTRYAVLCDPPSTVEFATTGADIATIYQKGASSCMSYSPDKFGLPNKMHPVEVYAAGDLQLAYLSASATITDINDPKFRTRARVLVWPEKKIYGRIYGDEHRMKNVLHKMGYRSDNLSGARIRLIKTSPKSKKIVMPYVDHISRTFYPEGDYSDSKLPDHLILGKGEICSSEAQTTGGSVELYKFPKMIMCAHHGKKFPDSEMFQTLDDSRTWFHHSVRSLPNSPVFNCAFHGGAYLNSTEHYFFGYKKRNKVVKTTFESHIARYPQDYVLCPKLETIVSYSDSVLLKDTKERVSSRWANRHAHEAKDPNSGRMFHYAVMPEPVPAPAPAPAPKRVRIKKTETPVNVIIDPTATITTTSPTNYVVRLNQL